MWFGKWYQWQCLTEVSFIIDLSLMDKNRSPSFLFILLELLVLSTAHFASGVEYISALGDPGMRRDGLRLAIESWNQCNEVGEEVPQMGSPRAADCFDIYKASPQLKGKLFNLMLLFYIAFLLSLKVHTSEHDQYCFMSSIVSYCFILHFFSAQDLYL